MQYPSTIEPNFYAHHIGGVIYALKDTDEQYNCGNSTQPTWENSGYILVTLNTKKDGSGESMDIRLYLDYLISVGDRYNGTKFYPCEDTTGSNSYTYLDRLVELQKSDIIEMVLQGYSKEYIESVIPYYLKTTNSDVTSQDSSVIVSGYSPYIYLRKCIYYRYSNHEDTNLINNTPINIDDAELWKDIALSEAQKTADKILRLGGQETCELEWVSDGESTQTPNDGLTEDPTIGDTPGDIIDNPGMGEQHG